MATHTHPGPWWQEDEEMVVTVVAVLNDQAEQVEQAQHSRR